MALTRTLAQLRESVQRTADIRAFTARHSEASLNDLVNRGIGALWRKTGIIDPHFRPIASTTITADGLSTEYGLPSNFRSLISVEYTADNEDTVWLVPYEMHERAALVDSNTTASLTHASHYRLLGDNIEFLPRPSEDDEFNLWYATTAAQLTADGQTVDVYDRLDDYIIWWAAREIAMDRKEWELHDRLSAKIDSLEADIAILARSRDLSTPSRIVDLRQADRFGRARWR